MTKAQIKMIELKAAEYAFSGHPGCTGDNYWECPGCGYNAGLGKAEREHDESSAGPLYLAGYLATYINGEDEDE